MRPFRFFFGLSLAVIVFLFFARFLVFAFVAAMVMSTVFFLFRKAKAFFQRMDWEEEPWQRGLQRRYGYSPLPASSDFDRTDRYMESVPINNYRRINVQ
jgi:hypothetical protein